MSGHIERIDFIPVVAGPNVIIDSLASDRIGPWNDFQLFVEEILVINIAMQVNHISGNISDNNQTTLLG